MAVWGTCVDLSSDHYESVLLWRERPTQVHGLPVPAASAKINTNKNEKNRCMEE